MKVAVGVAVVAASLTPTPARAWDEVLPAPNAFRLHGSNGFDLEVVASPAGFGRPSHVWALASKGNISAAYVAPAKVTPTSFEADFGPLGRVAVSYRAAGGVREMLGACGERAVFEGGYYEGTIEFHGEMGFTDVSANWATGRAPSFPCGWTSETVGGHLPGARLSVSNFGPDQQMFFTVYKNGPHQRADFRANLLEASGDVAIIRSVQVRGPADGFRYGSTSARAIVDPPAPFSGVCDFPQTPPVASDVDR